jgi:acetolactate synthase-1/3 small subunit
MTIVANVDTPMRELLIKQIKRLINVVQAVDLTEGPSVARELALIKVIVQPDMRHALLKEAEIFRARVVDASPTTYTLEVTGATEKLDALISLLHNYGEVEMIRTGAMAMARSRQQKLPNGFSGSASREVEPEPAAEPELAKRD